MRVLGSVSVCIETHVVKSHMSKDLESGLVQQKNKMVKYERSCCRSLLRKLYQVLVDRVRSVATQGKGFDTAFGCCQAGYNYINFEINHDINICSSVNERESTSHNVLLEHVGLLMYDLLQGLKTVCSDHHCDELLTIFVKV